MMNVDEFREWVERRFEVTLEGRSAELLFAKWIKQHSPVCWMLNRLREMYFGRLVGKSIPPDVRLTCELHMDWPGDGPMAEVLDVEVSPARSRISKAVTIISPIDGTSHRVSNWENLSNCLYCRQTFRNPAAAILHMNDSHGASCDERL